MKSGDAIQGLCTHYPIYDATSSTGVVRFGYRDSNIYLYNINYATADDLKADFAAQYAAGTPVTICYPVATPWEEDITNTPEGQSLIAAKTIPLYTHIYCEDDVKPYMDISIRTVHGG